jgi:hypothetical protein
MVPFDIYRISLPWAGCNDARPWLIIDVRPKGVFGSFPIASQCYQGRCYKIESSHEDFPSTGLTKTCHVHHGLIVEVTSKTLRAGKRLGRLEGSLRGHFCFACGLDIAG